MLIFLNTTFICTTHICAYIVIYVFCVCFRSAVKFFVNVDEQKAKVIKNGASNPYLCLPYDQIDVVDGTISKNCIEVQLRNNGCPKKTVIDISSKQNNYNISDNFRKF